MQSSTYTFRDVPLVAAFAVDNNLDSNLEINHACAHTELGDVNTLSWWAVDLGQKIKVSHVLITGRSDVYAPERLSDFNVGVSNYDPSTNYTPAPSTLFAPGVLCAHQEQYTDNKMDLTCRADIRPGRYLIVQFDSTPNYLTLCEVQVFGTPV
jgi:hypothetical protein